MRHVAFPQVRDRIHLAGDSAVRSVLHRFKLIENTILDATVSSLNSKDKADVLSGTWIMTQLSMLVANSGLPTAQASMERDPANKVLAPDAWAVKQKIVDKKLAGLRFSAQEQVMRAIGEILA